MFCNAYTQNSAYIYKLINFARHKEINIITTSRRPANINRSLTANTDTFYFAKISEPIDIKYFNSITGGAHENKLNELNKYEFLRYSEGGKLLRVKTTKKDLEIIDAL
jgi:hypothetical protein